MKRERLPLEVNFFLLLLRLATNLDKKQEYNIKYKLNTYKYEACLEHNPVLKYCP